MICAVHPVYITKAVAARATDADWAHLRTMVGPELAEDKTGYADYSASITIVDLEADLEMMTRVGLEVRVKRFRGQHRDSVPRLARDRYTEGAAVHVHVPNLGLLEVDEVLNLDDACTDELGRHLSDGWRILCVCPPVHQRRPDYILGRSRRDRNETR